MEIKAFPLPDFPPLHTNGKISTTPVHTTGGDMNWGGGELRAGTLFRKKTEEAEQGGQK